MSFSTANQYSSQVMNNVNSPSQIKDMKSREYEAIVVENRKHSDGNKIRFYIPELVPLVKGLLKDNPIPISRTYKDARGRQTTARGTTNNNFIAEYFSNDSYRKTPPDVQAGERVIVWRKDRNTWYWRPTSLDMTSKRRLETVVQSVNADPPKGPDSGKHGDDNTYYIENSSQNKTFTISTSKANGEVAAYKIQINAGAGCVVITDDVGNYIELDTGDTRIRLKNAMQTEVTLYENNIKVHCNENRDTTIGQHDTTKIGGNQSIEVQGNSDVTINGNCNVNINGSCTTKIGGDNTIDCANSTFTGNVNIKGGLSVSGASSLGGGGSVTGSLSISQSLSVAGKVSLNGGHSSDRIYGA